jgi:hypothetical protein
MPILTEVSWVNKPPYEVSIELYERYGGKCTLSSKRWKEAKRNTI